MHNAWGPQENPATRAEEGLHRKMEEVKVRKADLPQAAESLSFQDRSSRTGFWKSGVLGSDLNLRVVWDDPATWKPREFELTGALSETAPKGVWNFAQI